MAFRGSSVFYFLLLLFITSWFACGIYLFTNGFLLSRREINLTSTCQADGLLSDKSSTCWTVPSIVGVHKKVVVVIIDALRYDFAFYQDHPASDVPYINKLKIFQELARNKGCSHARLFKFRADAPTTTMQRIKGLTTGSFPTFIDISNNFDSSEITEDNLIDQIIKNKKANITFLGDDTWVKLFPSRFANSYPFPSFDVKDLHLVDNGIIKHLKPELLKNNWKVLIAHFLGVDHCGHRYGPMHSEMSSKLNQMNEVLRDVVDALDQDTLLLVMGDHGMTQTGDHGGETVDEIDSALFAFSPSGKFSQADSVASPNCDNGLVHQIDIVPTLSLLLGTPIPFSNLGAVIPDFIPDHLPSNLRDALLTNADQIQSYLNEYSRRYSEFSADQFGQLMDNFTIIKEESKTEEEILQLLYHARDLCKNIWAHFDEKSMVFGACLISSICVALLGIPYKLFFLILSTFVYCATYFFIPAKYQFVALSFSVLSLLVDIIYYFWNGKLSFLELLCPLLPPLIYFSNSFVNNEDVIIMYLYSSAVIILSLRVLQNSYSNGTKNHNTKAKNKIFLKPAQYFSLLMKPLGMFALLVVSFMLLTRAVFLFRICRPEQFWCFAAADQPSSNAAHYSGAHYLDEILNLSNPWSRLFLSGGSLVAILFLTKRKLQTEGNLRSPYSAAVMCSERLLPFAAFFIIGNWQLHTTSAEELDALPGYFVTFLPRCAYVLLLLSLIWWFIRPLTAHLLYRDKYGQFRDELMLTDNELISFYFKKLSQQAGEGTQRKKNGTNGNENSFVSPDLGLGQPAAFGLYTLFSAAIIGLGTVIILFGIMLLEERYAPVLLAFVISTGILLEILSAIYHRQGCTGVDVSLEVVGIWVLSCSYWWFATGHQASLSSIPWNAAFVGFQGSHPTIILPALMVGANIFISHILHTVFLPLLLLWPLTRGSWFSKTVTTKKSDVPLTSKRITEFELVQSATFWKSFSQLLYSHIFMHALKVLGSICAAFMHRRHLMVWQIFAPRLVYEVLGFFVVCATSVFVFVFTTLFKRSLNKWIRKENLNAATFK